MISFVVFSLNRAWQGFWRNAVMSLAATATMVLMLLLLAGFWIIQTGLLAGLQFTEQKVEVVAYLQTNATGQPDRRAPDASSRRCPRSRRSRYVSRDEALARLPGVDGGAGSRGPDPLPRQQPAATPASRSSWSTRRSVRVVGDALRGDPSVRNVDQHRGPRRARPDRDQHPADGGHGRPRRRRGDRPVHHRQHDPPRGRRPGRGDRDHAPRRRVGRLHPLAVRVRGRVRRAPRGRCSRWRILAVAADPIERLHGRLLPGPAAPVRLADARPRRRSSWAPASASASSARGCRCGRT